ncbi:CopG family ribbon-helix-helix protein [Belnapia sp. F-4-1]|uniref:CopG family ribbon-helix-helix protein n=1 Tax=Belnapia sp. F-4-1 TaxID=1545443 RepID=UPI0005BDB166|nr:ribbon-helix-helix protein, CopG family [Belnapia sp. F-4-1]
MADSDAVSVTVRMPAERRDALDGMARALDRDRSYLVNEAIAQFIEAQTAWAAHLQEAVRQADAGEFASSDEIAAAFAPRARQG